MKISRQIDEILMWPHLSLSFDVFRGDLCHWRLRIGESVIIQNIAKISRLLGLVSACQALRIRADLKCGKQNCHAALIVSGNAFNQIPVSTVSSK